MNRPVTVAEGQTATKYDHRAAVRHACHLEALSRSLEPSDTITWGAIVENLSRAGLALRLCYPFKPGTFLAVELRAGVVKRTLLARVVHVNDLKNGTWFLGCELAHPLAETDVALLL
jgi:hypothetical protein